MSQAQAFENYVSGPETSLAANATKADIASLKAEADVRLAGVKADIARLDNKIDASFTSLKAELDVRFSDVEVRFAKMEAAIVGIEAKIMKSTYNALFGFAAVIATVIIGAISVAVILLRL